MTQKTVFYPLTNEEWLRAVDTLRPAERKVLFYIRTLQPFDDGSLDLVIADTAKLLRMCARTLKRCLDKLLETGWITDIKIHTLTITLPSRSKSDEVIEPKKFLPTSGSKDPDPGSKDPDPGSFDPTPKNHPLPSKGFSDRPVTNNRGLNFKPNNGVNEPDQSEIGQILAPIQNVGIQINFTIQKTIYRLLREFGPAAAARRVELAIEALQEQSQKVTIRNPGGWLNSALLRCFTPNDDGYRRAPQSPLRSAAPAPAPAAPAPAVPPPLPDVDQLERTCDQLLLQGKRDRVLERLRELISEGYAAEVRSLLSLRRDWKFKLKGGTQLVDIS